MYLIAEHDDVRSSGFKMVVDCQTRLNNIGSTLGWLDNIQQLETLETMKQSMTNKRLLKAIFDKNKTVVVKIGNAQENIRHEFDIAQELYKHSIPGILQYFCYFTCNDDIRNYPAESPTHMCRAGRGENMRILVMEYISSPNFLQYDFKTTEITLFHSCIQQALSILFEAYISFGFVHGDTNLQNFLLRRSRKKTLTFPLLGINVPIIGYEICLMDFECSRYGDQYSLEERTRKFWDDIKYFFTKIIYTFRWDIDSTSIKKLNLYINKVSDKKPINEYYTNIIEIVYTMQFMKYNNKYNPTPQNVTYNPQVFGGNRKTKLKTIA